MSTRTLIWDGALNLIAIDMLKNLLVAENALVSVAKKYAFHVVTSGIQEENAVQ